MDVLIDDVADLDGPLLAALWTRAVLAGDAEVIARCEIECEARGITPGTLVASCRRVLVGASKKDDTVTVTTGETKGPGTYRGIAAQSQKNIREGKSWKSGQHTYKTQERSKGTNPYRRGKGKGGGQFTSKENAGKSEPSEVTDPKRARDGAELQEDDPKIPYRSPGGAAIKDFRNGMMIYADGTRYDKDGWRNAKGEALDDDGEVIRKKTKGAKAKAKGGGGGGGGGKGTAERAAKEAVRERERAWDSAEARRKAEEAAKDGNYASLLSIVERNERDARKRRDLATTAEERTKAEADVAAAQQELAATREAADQAREAGKAKREAEAEADRKAKQAARYAEIAANYPAWEKELRDQYADVGLSEAELQELIIRDRARRVALLPR